MFVYFIKDKEGKIKIGCTKKDPNKRMQEFQIPNLELLFYIESKNFRKLEIALHFRFNKYSIGREWFMINDYSIEELKEISNKVKEAVDLVC